MREQTKEREKAQTEAATAALSLDRLGAELQRYAAQVKERDKQVWEAEIKHTESVRQFQAVQLERENLAGENRALREELAALRQTRAAFHASLQLALERLQDVGAE